MIGAFESTVRQFPQRTCFTYVDEAGNETAYSYRETRMLSAALARLLLDRGVRPGDCVAVDLPNDPAYVLVMLAAAYGGFALVALNNRLTDAAGQSSVSDATAHAACLTAKDVNASAIVTVSESGNTARLLSKYRPSQPIIATSTDELIEKSTALAKEHGYLHDGELAVVTAGVPVGVSGTTNMIKIHMIGNCLATGVGVGPEGAALANATGKACVCHTLEEIRAKFKPGMVLVVPSTSNEMLSYVRDAAALVVEEAGLNSHAAIAGKALLKPTIVGAVGATAHIRDGLMVAVDCAHGSVQRLQA